MPTFRTVDPVEIMPKTQKGPKTDRAIQNALLREQLEAAFSQGLALVVELEDSDKPLTVRNRLVRAAQASGFQVYIRRSGNVINVRQTGTLSTEEVQAVAPKKPGRKAKK